MVVIAGTITLDPANREAAVSAATEMMAATRKEPGCHSYTMSADLADSGRFHIFEEWESQAALEAHFATPHMASFQAAVGGLGIREMQVQKYEVSSVGPIR
jgi:quinol monooxygenase YgiN